MSNKRYAIWYEPIGDVYTKLSKTIKDLSNKYESPLFVPHITLLPGGSSLDKETVINKLQNVLKSKQRFITKFASISHSDAEFRCIFIEVEQSPELINFSEQIQKEFNGKAVDNYYPHLTIFYGQYPQNERENIIKSLNDDFSEPFELNAVKVIEYEFNKPPETWKEVASIEVKENF